MSEGGLGTQSFLLNIQKETSAGAAQKRRSAAASPHTTLAPLQTDCSAVISAPDSNGRKSTEFDPNSSLHGQLPGKTWLSALALSLN